MSRAGYSEDIDNWAVIRWRGAVAAAIRGKRGQAFLREMLKALDTQANGILIANELETDDGAVCAIGAVGKARGVDMTQLDPYEGDEIAYEFGIAEALAREIVYENDEGRWSETPRARFERMRGWIISKIDGDL